MTRNTKSILLGAVAVLSWSTVATAFKTSLRYYGYYEMLSVASVTALCIFAVVLTLQGKWGVLRSLSPRQWGTMAALGLLNPVAYYLVLFSSYSLLPAQVAQPVNYCWPIILTVFLALFAGKSISRGKYLGMAVSLAGVTLISVGGGGLTAGGLSMAGLVLAFLSAVLWATYWMLDNSLKTVADDTVKLFVSFLFGTVYLAAGLLWVDADFSSSAGMWSSVYVGAFEVGIPFLCFGAALRITSNVALINQMCYLSPFMSLFFIAVVLGEPILPSTYIGLLLIVGGIVFNQYFADRRRMARVA